MFEFQNLIVYQKARSFHKAINLFLTTVSVERASADQLRRASLSIVLNLAEGSSRYTNPDRRHFFVISRGSVFESVAVLDVLLDQGIIIKDDYKELILLADEISRILFSMIRNLGK